MRKQQLDDGNIARGEGEKRATNQKCENRDQYVAELRCQFAAVHASLQRVRGSPEMALALVGDIEAHIMTNEAIFDAIAAVGAAGGTSAVLERLVGGPDPAAPALLHAYVRLAAQLDRGGAAPPAPLAD